jgi:hypothetical protein
MTIPTGEPRESNQAPIVLDAEHLERARSRRPRSIPPPSPEELSKAAEELRKRKPTYSDQAVVTPGSTQLEEARRRVEARSEFLYGPRVGECAWCGLPVRLKDNGPKGPAKQCPQSHSYVHETCWNENSGGTDRGCPQMGCLYGPDTPEG